MSTFDTLMSAGTHAMASVRDDSKGDRQVVQTAETHNTQHSVLPIRVVLPRGQKETVLYTVAVCSTDTGETVMKKLRAKNQEHCSQFSAIFEPFLRALVMQSIAVHVATVSPSDVEQQAYPQRVLIEAKEYSAVLTNAYCHPHVRRSATGFANSYLQDVVRTVHLEPMAPLKALYIGYVYDRKIACIWGGIVLLLSVASGFIAGVVTGHPMYGLAFGGGSLAWLSMIQGLIIWWVG